MSSITVSYTHLEFLITESVEQISANRELFKELRICSLAYICITIVPVSYTHLDVYKRQTVRYAHKKGKTVIVINPVSLDVTRE